MENRLGGHYNSEESVDLLVDALRIFAAATIRMLNGSQRVEDAKLTADVYRAFSGI